MGKGSSGDAVEDLQLALVICHGLGTGGIYGGQIAAAVRTLQPQTGLYPDGVYGPDTRGKISWRWYASQGVGATFARV